MRGGLWSLFSKELIGSLAKGGGADGARLLSRQAEAGGRSFTFQVAAPPPASEVAGKPPVIVFLHGINQRGTGGFVPAGGPAGALVRGLLSRVPAVVMLPQCQPGSYWSDPLMEETVMAALEQTAAEFGADPARLYLAGASMGGYGVWSLAARYGRQFAALVSLCGGSPLRSGERFRAVARSIGPVPSWLFHGTEDRVVPVTESRQMAEAMRENGGEVRYSEYAGVGHDVWTRALAERELLPWLLSKRL
jgi:predicted peptidase